MRYAIARFEEHQKKLAYKVYVSDTLRLISENTARFGGGSYFKQRWIDFVQDKPKDTRSGNEIAAEVIKKAGLEVRRNGTI